MRLFAFLWSSVAFLSTVQAQVSQTASQTQDDSSTPTPTPPDKYVNIADALRTKTPMATPNRTIMPTRQDPRAPEPPTPEPTYLPTLSPTPAPTPDPGPWVAKWMDHDQVQPFKQPDPVTVSEKAAVKFKPQIHITNGCHPYPAVTWWGETSGGLKTKGAPSAGCKGSGWGSQVYGRSTWVKGVWAIMYSWYFPKDSPSTGLGHRHDWEHVIVWIDNPDIENPKILAVTPSAHSGYSKQVPPSADCVDGTSVKVKYESKWPINHALESTTEGGETQDLIMWNQLSENALRAMNSVTWGDANCPFCDGNFQAKLDKAWPF
uniref:NLP effector protein 9 n=1 Tax=Phytophthora capsici TaxID=4784 RepID=NLP9_PHYCP|nr:RecName: Full=NLP effector protein 9; AltName: Full=Necrosis-inducing protein 9; AltName: Full=Nep1-like protein 9; Flags: Precursor [Phytophthora capsici]AEJ88240.1 necrosis inducing protein NPP9 [Phytophthora capsici]